MQDELARAYETMADGYGHAARAEANRLTNYQKSLAIREGFLGKEPSSAKPQRSIALCEEKLGDAWARSGAERAAPDAQRIHAWSEARDWYKKSDEIFSNLRAHGTLTPTDADKPQVLSRRGADCDRAIGLLMAAH